MRRIVAAFLVGMAATASAQQPDLKMFSWLAGVWEMTDGSRTVEEQWTAPTANALIGMSRTVAGDRTMEFEFLRIEQRGGDIFYIPQPGGRPPVAFRLASSDGGRYIFESTTGEDRVKRIEYRREGDDGLYARLEGVQGGGAPFALEYRYRRRK